MTLVEFWLRFSGFQSCERRLRQLASMLSLSSNREFDPELAQHIADVVDRSSYTTSLYPAQCLPRSLVLHYYLLRFGQPSELKLGVQIITGDFRSHAWVECDGIELNESLPANELYVPIDWTRRPPGAWPN